MLALEAMKTLTFTVKPGHPFPHFVCSSINPEFTIPNLASLKRLLRIQADEALTPHTHASNQLEILYLAKGRQDQTVNGHHFTLGGNEILVIPPQSKHSSGGLPQEKALMYWVVLDLPPAATSFMGFDPAIADQLLPHLRTLPLLHTRGTPAMQAQLDAVLRNVEYRDTPFWRARAISHLTLFLSEVITCASNPKPVVTSVWKARIMKAIEQHLDTLREGATAPHTADLALKIGLSPARFAVYFKQFFGIPPAEYILRRRIELAKSAMVTEPDRTVTDIAIDLGFSSSNNFATAFKRYTGTTPTRFRQNLTHDHN